MADSLGLLFIEMKKGAPMLRRQLDKELGGVLRAVYPHGYLFMAHGAPIQQMQVRAHVAHRMGTCRVNHESRARCPRCSLIAPDLP